MSRKVRTFNELDRRLKRLQKKFRTLKGELTKLGEELVESTQRPGSNMGNGLYKIRLGSASKGGGKRGGFRVITYYVEQTPDGEVVYLVTIYDKSEEANILKTDLLNTVKQELEQ